MSSCPSMSTYSCFRNPRTAPFQQFCSPSSNRCPDEPSTTSEGQPRKEWISWQQDRRGDRTVFGFREVDTTGTLCPNRFSGGLSTTCTITRFEEGLLWSHPIGFGRALATGQDWEKVPSVLTGSPFRRLSGERSRPKPRGPFASAGAVSKGPRALSLAPRAFLE